MVRLGQPRVSAAEAHRMPLRGSKLGKPRPCTAPAAASSRPTVGLLIIFTSTRPLKRMGRGRKDESQARTAKHGSTAASVAVPRYPADTPPAPKRDV